MKFHKSIKNFALISVQENNWKEVTELFILFQELLVILSLTAMVILFQPKIKIMTAGRKTVPRRMKEPGGTGIVITPTWMVGIILAITILTPMVSTGISGKDTIIHLRELRWKSDQWSFKNFQAGFSQVD